MSLLKDPPFHLPRPLPNQLRRAILLTFFFMSLMFGGSIVLDQATKLASQSKLMVYSSEEDHRQYQGTFYPVFIVGNNDGKSNFLSLNFSYVRNPGAAWGAFADMNDKVRTPLFHVITVIAVAMIFLYMVQTPFHHRLTQFGLTLILSGAVGNFIDRVRLGFVIDWIDFRWNIFGWYYAFPNFNVADSAISVGAALWLFDSIFLERLRQRAAK
jgi:signal peptidase II